jgi:hypothetical protein
VRAAITKGSLVSQVLNGKFRSQLRGHAYTTLTALHVDVMRLRHGNALIVTDSVLQHVSSAFGHRPCGAGYELVCSLPQGAGSATSLDTSNTPIPAATGVLFPADAGLTTGRGGLRWDGVAGGGLGGTERVPKTSRVIGVSSSALTAGAAVAGARRGGGERALRPVRVVAGHSSSEALKTSTTRPAMHTPTDQGTCCSHPLGRSGLDKGVSEKTVQITRVVAGQSSVEALKTLSASPAAHACTGQGTCGSHALERSGVTRTTTWLGRLRGEDPCSAQPLSDSTYQEPGTTDQQLCHLTVPCEQRRVPQHGAPLRYLQRDLLARAMCPLSGEVWSPQPCTILIPWAFVGTMPQTIKPFQAYLPQMVDPRGSMIRNTTVLTHE